MKLGFLGGGVMGESIIGGVLRNGVAQPQDIAVCEIVAARRDHLARTHGVRVGEAAAETIAGSEIVILAVKPQEFAAAATGLAGHLRPGQTVISIMAGITIDTISKTLRHDAIVRAIPNTPAQIGEGVTVWTATASVSAAARDAVRQLLSILGLEIQVDEEKYVDMATAVSSSGPAYVFLVMEAMIDAAVHIGLKRETATPMVIQTFLGSARYALSTHKHPAELRNQVTSPGGTTTEGLAVLEDAALRSAFLHAIEAAYEKAKLLGG
jgi:pyrroline-5-carboxylate reductase